MKYLLSRPCTARDCAYSYDTTSRSSTSNLLYPPPSQQAQQEPRHSRGAAADASTMAAPQQGVIESFTNEEKGFLGDSGRLGALTYTGDIVAGNAEGRGTVRCNAGRWTLRDAEFSGASMLPSGLAGALRGAAPSAQRPAPRGK
jgi:hypothetical protein